jgi:DNA-binding transcriptional ArsR family regulator
LLHRSLLEVRFADEYSGVRLLIGRTPVNAGSGSIPDMSDRLGQVLAHPLRHRLLFEYWRAPANPARLARRLGEPVNRVSYHTGVLREHGMVELVRTEQRHGATTHVYRAPMAQIIEDAGWEAVPGRQRRALVRGLLAAIGDEAQQAASDGGFDAGHAHISRWPVSIDAQAEAEIIGLLRELLEDLLRLQTDCETRAPMGRRGHSIVLMGFRVPDQSRARSQRASCCA